MKTHIYQVRGKNMEMPWRLPGSPAESTGETSEVKNIREIQKMANPEYRTVEIWFEDSLAPIRLNENRHPSPVQDSRSGKVREGNAFDTWPYSEIYNMAAMWRSY